MNSSVKKNILFLFFVVFISVFILISPETSLAESVYYNTECGEKILLGSFVGELKCATCCGEYSCWPCCPCCNQYSCSGSWTEYKADTAGCEPKILKRECKSVCGPTTACCSCGPCQAQCDSWETCEECGNWQKADRSCEVTKAGLEKPKAKCNGDCIDVSANPRYYDNPNEPIDTCEPEEGKDQNDIYLPVKLDWDDVKGWGKEDGWREDETCPKTCSAGCPVCPGSAECYEEPECVQSYAIKITQKAVLVNGETIEPEKVMVDEKVLDKSEYNILEENDSCFLKPNRTYEWQVKACCDADGESCGAWSEPWSFTANAAPEPKSPYDPDWEGEGTATNVPFEGLKLAWCETEFDPGNPEEESQKPLSFKLKFYVIEDEEEKCHPELWTGEKCLEKALLPEKEWIKSPPPEFSNEKYGYFTKDTFYGWTVAACQDKFYQQCTDYSQKWRFSTEEFGLEKTAPFSPPNDPLGLKPVGLPVVLLWTSPPGVMSYRYEVSGIEERKTKSPSASFDYPELDIDTAYTWKVKSCWDYDAEECEDEWSEVFHFRTTGRPPQLTYPKEDIIPIPVKFEWEAVGGAESYVFKIQGPGLIIEEPVEKPEFSLDYPDLKQEADYSWQVKTCAKEGGNVCGEYSELQDFKTFKLPPPTNPAPQDSGEILSYQKSQALSWQAEYGKFYEYEVNYVNVSPEEMNPACQPKEIIPLTVTNLKNSQPLTLICFGDYQWRTRACFDENCEDASEWSQDWHFSFVAAEEPTGIWGIVPCGKVNYNPNTPWDEREPCQIKHIFLLIRNVIDFFLWTFFPILLVLLVLVTGLLFYFSVRFQDAAVIPRIKLLWKAAGIGFGVVFFAWVILNLFLGLMGFQVDIFGQWYEISL